MTNKQKQAILAFFGCYDGDLDGDWGSLSLQGTAKLQRLLNIPDDGVWGPQTDAAARKAIGESLDLDTANNPVQDVPVSGTSWGGIKYWTREEFRCQCGGKYCNGFPAEPDKKLVLVAENIRNHFGRPGHRSSGLRCKTWNAIQGGVSNSRHLTGKALDFRIEGHSASQVLAYAITLPDVRYAYDIDGTYVHVDVE